MPLSHPHLFDPGPRLTPQSLPRTPILRAPGTRLRGPHWLFCFFEALGRLIGLLHRAPLWGSAQACSSCWVCRRRKEQRLIPLQVSLSVATLHFQWLGKVTSAPAKLAQESHKQHQLEKYRKRCWGFLCRENGRFFFFYLFLSVLWSWPKAPFCMYHWMILEPQLNNQTPPPAMLFTASLVWIMD